MTSAGLREPPLIPARDDAAEFHSYSRPARFFELLATLGVSPAGRRVVDLGTGYGSLAIQCARAGATEVVAFDANTERLDIVSSRAAAAGVDVQVRHGNLLRPPSLGPFDLAFLIGVVEYAGLWEDDEPVQNLQRQVFRTAYDSLSPGGELVFGSKCRYWPRLLVDDVHTGVRFANALPRRWASAISRRREGRPYRHYIHGRRTWSRLITEAGFSSVRSYVPYFSYQLPVHITEKASFRDVQQIRKLPLSEEERAAALGSRWLPKAVLMGLAGTLRVPLSQCVFMIARK